MRAYILHITYYNDARIRKQGIPYAWMFARQDSKIMFCE